MLWDAAASGRSSSRIPMGTTSQSFSPRMILDQHIAAVKAVAWCPWQRNILATGGGTADRTIRIWNAQDGANLQSVDTGSQVCAIQWSSHYKELVSSHGFSDNQLIVWKYRDMSKVRSPISSTPCRVVAVWSLSSLLSSFLAPRTSRTQCQSFAFGQVS